MVCRNFEGLKQFQRDKMSFFGDTCREWAARKQMSLPSNSSPAAPAGCCAKAALALSRAGKKVCSFSSTDGGGNCSILGLQPLERCPGVESRRLLSAIAQEMSHFHCKPQPKRPSSLTAASQALLLRFSIGQENCPCRTRLTEACNSGDLKLLNFGLLRWHLRYTRLMIVEQSFQRQVMEPVEPHAVHRAEG